MKNRHRDVCDYIIGKTLPVVWSHWGRDTVETDVVGRSSCCEPGCWWLTHTGNAEKYNMPFNSIARKMIKLYLCAS